VLAVDVQRRLARHQQPDARRRVDDGARNARHRFDEVLGVVEHDQRGDRPQRDQQARQRILALRDRQPERMRERRGKQRRVADAREVHPGRWRVVRVRRRLCQSRLADATRTDHRDDAVLGEQAT
jgi:hypothetical protein